MAMMPGARWTALSISAAWAHARRKFTDALKARQKPGGPPWQALKFFEALYEVERLARQTPSEGETRADYTLRLRQQHSLPVLTAFKTWLDEPGAEGPARK